jgi:hypothetical protein
MAVAGRAVRDDVGDVRVAVQEEVRVRGGHGHAPRVLQVRRERGVAEDAGATAGTGAETAVAVRRVAAHVQGRHVGVEVLGVGLRGHDAADGSVEDSAVHEEEDGHEGGGDGEVDGKRVLEGGVGIVACHADDGPCEEGVQAYVDEDDEADDAAVVEDVLPVHAADVVMVDADERGNEDRECGDEESSGDVGKIRNPSRIALNHGRLARRPIDGPPEEKRHPRKTI